MRERVYIENDNSWWLFTIAVILFLIMLEIGVISRSLQEKIEQKTQPETVQTVEVQE